MTNTNTPDNRNSFDETKLNMAIQWFPGHMNSTRRAILERAVNIDVVIELLDARLPGSSLNPLLAELTRGKPALKVLNKQDLADPDRTALWLAHYNALPATQALGLDASVIAPAQRLIAACRALAPLRGGMTKPLRVLICGIPNVGKSTLINTLVGRKATKTGDEPGITKLEQKIVLASDVYVYDTPGMLWPRITVPQSGYHLAASGGMGRNAYNEEEVALELLDCVNRNYPGRVAERFKLPDMSTLTEEEQLTEIAKKRGAIQSGGRVNLQKAAEILMGEFRTGGLGLVTLETPLEMAQWQAEAEVAEVARREKKKKKTQATEG